jgi:hypothetical protein
MPGFKPYTKRQLDHALELSEKSIYTVEGHLDVRAFCTAPERQLALSDKWGDLFD